MPLEESLVGHLRGLEESFFSADARSMELLSSLLAEDFIEYGSSGRVYTKEETIAILAARSPGRIMLREFSARLLASDLALVTYRARQDRVPAVETLRSSLWRLREGKWQIVFHQGTLSASDR